MTKYIFLGDGVFYNNELQELEITEVTDEAMIQYGSDELTADLTGYKSVTIYKYNNEEEKPALKVKMRASPFPQTVQAEVDISNSTITGIEKVTADYTGSPFFAFSFDGRQTWKIHNGSAWVVLSEGETGMQADALESITPEQWQEQIEGLSSFWIRFAMTVETDRVSKVLVDFTN